MVRPGGIRRRRDRGPLRRPAVRRFPPARQTPGSTPVRHRERSLTLPATRPRGDGGCGTGRPASRPVAQDTAG